jgi:uncharacterized BrkB/YihY/UPF0761 family membrane protein
MLWVILLAVILLFGGERHAEHETFTREIRKAQAD